MEFRSSGTQIAVYDSLTHLYIRRYYSFHSLPRLSFLSFRSKCTAIPCFAEWREGFPNGLLPLSTRRHLFLWRLLASRSLASPSSLNPTASRWMPCQRSGDHMGAASVSAGWGAGKWDATPTPPWLCTTRSSNRPRWHCSATTDMSPPLAPRGPFILEMADFSGCFGDENSHQEFS